MSKSILCRNGSTVRVKISSKICSNEDFLTKLVRYMYTL